MSFFLRTLAPLSSRSSIQVRTSSKFLYSEDKIKLCRGLFPFLLTSFTATFLSKRIFKASTSAKFKAISKRVSPNKSFSSRGRVL